MEYPSFYGETLPVISRAIDDDEDDQEQARCTVSVQWSPQAEDEMSKSEDHCLQCTVLITAVGVEAAGFAKTYLLQEESTELIGVVCCDVGENTSKTWSQHTPSDKSCSVHRLKRNPGVLIIRNTSSVPQYQAASWTDQVFRCIDLKGTYVAVLMSDMTSNYRCEECHSDLRTPFLRSLNTSAFQGTPVSPYLEQPNVISGLPAQIMTVLEMQRVSAVLYICYKDVSCVDINTIKLFRKILQSKPLKDFVVGNPNADSHLVQLAELHRDKSMLYI